MSDEKRQYRMKRRAEQEAQTRLRITESAVDLHGTLGPAHTSVSAVAEHAGVRRSTVYRHFPDERRCSAPARLTGPHQSAARRRPLATIADPDARLDAALAELYAYYRQTEGMLEQAPARRPRSAGRRRADGRLPGDAERGHRRPDARQGPARPSRDRTRAAVGHALAFSTWQDLTGRRASTTHRPPSWPHVWSPPPAEVSGEGGFWGG